MVISGLTTGACYLLFAYSPSFYFSLAIMPVIGYSVMRQMASANTTIQTLIPDEYRGRIMALYAMTVVGLGPFGSLAAGALAGRFGPRLTMAAGRSARAHRLARLRLAFKERSDCGLNRRCC